MPSLSERVAAARQTETQEVSSTRSDALSELRGRLHFKVVEELGPTLYDRQMSDAELRLRVLEMLEWAVDQEQGLPLTSADRRALLNEIASDVLGYGPLEPLLRAADTTDVLVNAPDSIWVDRGAGLCRVPVSFPDEAAVRSLAQRLAALAGRRLDDSPIERLFMMILLVLFGGAIAGGLLALALNAMRHDALARLR